MVSLKEDKKVPLEGTEKNWVQTQCMSRTEAKLRQPLSQTLDGDFRSVLVLLFSQSHRGESVSSHTESEAVLKAARRIRNTQLSN